MIDQGKFDYKYLENPTSNLVVSELPEITAEDVFTGRLDYSIRYMMSKADQMPSSVIPIDIYVIGTYRGSTSTNKRLDAAGFLDIYYNKPNTWPMRPVAMFRTKSPISNNDSIILVQEIQNKDGTKTYLKYLFENSKRWAHYFNDLVMFGGKYETGSFTPLINLKDNILPLPSPDLVKLYLEGVSGKTAPYNDDYEKIVFGAQKQGKIADDISGRRLFLPLPISLGK